MLLRGLRFERSRRHRLISIAGKRTGPTRDFTARPNDKWRRCLPKSVPRLLPLPLEPFRYYGFVSAGPPRWLCRSRGGLLQCATRLDWSPRRRAMERPLRALARSENRSTVPGTFAGEARLASHCRRRSLDTHATKDGGAAGGRDPLGPSVGTLCHQHPPSWKVKRGPAHPGCALTRQAHWPRSVEDASTDALELGVHDVSLSAALSRAVTSGATHPAASRPADPSVHELPLLHPSHDRIPTTNLVELDCALRQLRLAGMAAILETRLQQAQTEKMVPIDLASALVTDGTSQTRGSLTGTTAQTRRLS